MLRELHIANLAIIEKVDIELAPGLNVFTGQTGAGKSLILGALELLLGLRGGGDDAAMFIRPSSAEARVSGVFEVAGKDTAEALGKILDQEIRAGESVLITRRVLASGRSSVSVNGSPVTAGMLRQAGQLLVDIHGQHDQQFLLKPANQLSILDDFADALDARRQFTETFGRLRESRERLRELAGSEARRAELLDLYRFQIEEIDSAGPKSGEFAQAANRHSVLKNLAHLKGRSAEALHALSEGEDSIADRLGKLVRTLGELAKVDASLNEMVAQVQQTEGSLADVARSLARYQDSLDIDPDELGQVEARLDVLNKLIHKYARSAAPGADGVEAVLAHRAEIGRRVEQLESDAQALGGLGLQIEQAQRDLARCGERLTVLRRKAAGRLKTLVEAQFRELEMHEATFDVQITTRKADDPQVDSTGLDEIEFLVRTNPGQERLPLRRIASGGEVSRIMLALKTILADKDRVSVLVFDEIDANIGDRLGATIGRKMRALAHGARGQSRRLGLSPVSPTQGRGQSQTAGQSPAAHQILCITHLSQIAACADYHIQISKEVVGPAANRQTVAKVRILDGEDKVRELADMMAGKGVTAATIAHARELLARAQQRGSA
ncbi:MAG: DNA repair protein RecN [Phycisphaerae bacterium]